MTSEGVITGPKTQRQPASSAAACKTCGLRFLRSDHLRRHQQTHTNDRPHRCRFCSWRFLRRDVLNRHELKVHAAEQDALRRSTAISQEDSSNSTSLNVKRPSPKCASRAQTSGSSQVHVKTIGKTPIEVVRGLKTQLPLEFTETWREMGQEGGYDDTGSLMATSPSNNGWSEVTSAYTYSDIAGLLGLRPPLLNPSNHRASSMDRQTPKLPAPTQQSVFSNDILNGISIEPLVRAYQKYLYPFFPCLHQPTLVVQIRQSHHVALCSPTYVDYDEHMLAKPLPRGLILSILAIGAVFNGQSWLAYKLHQETRAILQTSLRELGKRGEQAIPIHILQTLLHHIAFGLSSGEPQIEHSSISHMTSLVMLANQVKETTEARACLQNDKSQQNQTLQTRDWIAWIRQEEAKRTLFSIMCLTSLTQNFLNATPDLDLKSTQIALPCDEATWDAGNFETWKVEASKEAGLICRTFGEELSSLVKPRFQFNPSQYLLDTFRDHQQTHPSPGHRISIHGCYVLIAALNLDACNVHNNGCNCTDPWHESCHDSMGSRLVEASKLWQRIWAGFSREKISETENAILTNCTPIFDHINLLLKVDISATKACLQDRLYEQVGPKLYHDPTDEIDLSNAAVSTTHCSESCESTSTALLSAAQYSIDALDSAFGEGSRSARFNEVSLISAMMIFHCTHILCSWLLAQRAATFWDDCYTWEQQDIMIRCKKIAGIYPVDERTQPNLRYQDSDLRQVAIQLLTSIGTVFACQGTWGGFSHLVKGLNCRAEAILKSV
ncbi:hypothetical protein IQ07DRAFT_224640 [Pyrenochaeta sp. DS3sAY3a]|nr:hypothetical protein IQ07DRAFT_224640 [Pyrenochaeta sp. DS3sAY3a]